MLPLIAMIASAALSDNQNNQAQSDAHLQSYEDTINKINRTRAQQLGAQPYSFMVDDMERSNHAVDKAANASRNNNIGAMLQSYFLNSKSGADEPEYEGVSSAGQDFGGDSEIPGIQGGNLGGFDDNPIEGSGLGRDNWINPSKIGSTLDNDPWAVA